MRSLRFTLALLVAGGFALNAAVDDGRIEKVILGQRDTTLVSERYTNGAPRGPLSPGPDDARIARGVRRGRGR